MSYESPLRILDSALASLGRTPLFGEILFFKLPDDHDGMMDDMQHSPGQTRVIL